MSPGWRPAAAHRSGCFAAPALATLGRDQRLASTALYGLVVVGLAGCFYAPLGTAWISAALLGLGQGGQGPAGLGQALGQGALPGGAVAAAQRRLVHPDAAEVQRQQAGDQHQHGAAGEAVRPRAAGEVAPHARSTGATKT